MRYMQKILCIIHYKIVYTIHANSVEISTFLWKEFDSDVCAIQVSTQMTDPTKLNSCLDVNDISMEAFL